MVKKDNKKVIELSKDKDRKEEEEFFTRFSGTQLNAVLLFILADTFFVQGVTRYMELINSVAFIKPWLILIISSLFFFVTSVVSITVCGIISPLKTKRKINIISFGTFVMGVVLFLASLFFLLMLI